MKKIHLIGVCGFNLTEFAQRCLKDDVEVIIVNNADSKNVNNVAFEPEPVYIKNFRKVDFKEPVIELSRHKYFDKPLRNFKKR